MVLPANSLLVTEAEQFWEGAARIYDEKIDYVFGNNLRQIFIDILEKEPPLGQAVEFGCGTGSCTRVLARLSASLVATDMADEMLERTRRRAGGIPSVTVRKENCENATFPPGSFDTAFLGLTFHMVDGLATLAEMHRILKPGGRLLITIPTVEGLGPFAVLRGILRNKKVFGRFTQPGSKLYTEVSIRELFAGSGFSIQDIERVCDPDRPGGFSGFFIRAVKR